MKSVFVYRAPTEEEKRRLAALQEGWLRLESLIHELDQAWKDTSSLIASNVPPGDERSRAISRLTECRRRASEYPLDAIVLLQECRMWANAGVVLNREE